MYRLIVIIQLVFATTFASAQEFKTDWYVLEKGASAGIIKAGVNDLVYYLAVSNNKPIDRAAVDAMNERVAYNAGDVVLIYAKVNDTYVATDMEGRNIVIKGNVTKAEHTSNSGVAYLNDNIKMDNGTTLKKGAYVWMKKRTETMATIQSPGKKDIDVPVSKVLSILDMTIEMAGSAKFKEVQ